MPNRRVTSADVAREAGLSRATVGYVLNNVPHQTIPETTRARVHAAAVKLGYTPSAAARSLRTGRSDIVLALLPDWPVGHAIVQLLEALSTQLEGHGFTFVTHPRSASERSLSEIWKAITPAVLLTLEPLAADETAALTASGTRVVTLDTVTAADLGSAGEADGVGLLQVAHLVDRGRTRLGYAYPDDTRLGVFARPRLAEVRCGCADRGLEEPLVREIPLRAGAAVDALRAWHAAGVDGICCYNDELAVALVGAAARTGIEVPGVIAVIGVDDLPVGALCAPAITTIATDFDQIAAQVAARLTGGDLPAASTTRLHRLVVREST